MSTTQYSKPSHKPVPKNWGLTESDMYAILLFIRDNTWADKEFTSRLNKSIEDKEDKMVQPYDLRIFLKTNKSVFVVSMGTFKVPVSLLNINTPAELIMKLKFAIKDLILLHQQNGCLGEDVSYTDYFNKALGDAYAQWVSLLRDNLDFINVINDEFSNYIKEVKRFYSDDDNDDDE